MTEFTIPRRRLRPATPFRILLLEKGVTVSDAAEALGVSRPLLSAVLHGHRPASKALAARIATLDAALRQEDDGMADHDRA